MKYEPIAKRSGWYTIDLALKCECGKPAKVELFNRFNERQGKFCRRCATKKLNISDKTYVPFMKHV